jgi:hypothetical protein
VFVLILEIVEAALSIWSSELKQKYIDQVALLKQEYYAETNKLPADRSDAVLDNLEFQLRIAASSLASSILGKPQSADIYQGTGV